MGAQLATFALILVPAPLAVAQELPPATTANGWQQLLRVQPGEYVLQYTSGFAWSPPTNTVRRIVAALEGSVTVRFPSLYIAVLTPDPATALDRRELRAALRSARVAVHALTRAGESPLVEIRELIAAVREQEPEPALLFAGVGAVAPRIPRVIAGLQGLRARVNRIDPRHEPIAADPRLQELFAAADLYGVLIELRGQELPPVDAADPVRGLRSFLDTPLDRLPIFPPNATLPVRIPSPEQRLLDEFRTTLEVISAHAQRLAGRADQRRDAKVARKYRLLADQTAVLAGTLPRWPCRPRFPDRRLAG